MENEKNKITLAKLNERIDAGEWDKYLSIPFATKKLLKSVIKTKINKKVEVGNTPMLTEAEIQLCIQEVRETAAYTTSIFLNNGILEKTENSIILGDLSKKLFKTA